MELDDPLLVWASIELVFEAVSIYDGVEILDAGLALATPRQRHFHAFWWTQSEIRNGGFHQYFSNTTGIVAPIALDGLRALGATAAADAVAAACAPFAQQLQDREHRRAILAELEITVFREYDAAFYAAYPQAFELAAAYVREHPLEFFE